MTRTPDPGGEHGAAALLVTAVGLLLVAALCVALPTATGVALLGMRARAAADATALAVLSGSPLAGTPPRRPSATPPLAEAPDAWDDLGDGPSSADLELADRVARANDAALIATDPGGWPTSVITTVEVRPAGPLGRFLPPVRASATARLDPP